ncbi:MAG: carbon-nitrogen hydrolase family protein [Anaerolineae bacterium]|nr:carbon-nitrogen hydrolase family protein [Anaerolineae bacterium]
MSRLNVALLQMVPFGIDQEANRAKGMAFCRQARGMGADIALFPEMWNVGYSLLEISRMGEREGWHTQAVCRDGAFVTGFRELARELDMAIAITYLERWDGPPRNTVSLIDRHGEIVLTYAKVHTCDFNLEAALTPGDDFYVGVLDTARGHVKVGAMICYDREFPESARILMLKGAEIILTPNACGIERNRIAQLRTRAYENMVGVAMANYAAPKCNGHSIAFDGMAFGEDGASRDMLLVEAGEAEGIYMASFDLDGLRAYRSREIWGNAFRRPRCYTELTSSRVEPPFIRAEARR